LPGVVANTIRAVYFVMLSGTYTTPARVLHVLRALIAISLACFIAPSTAVLDVIHARSAVHEDASCDSHEDHHSHAPTEIPDHKPTTCDTCERIVHAKSFTACAPDALFVLDFVPLPVPEAPCYRLEALTVDREHAPRGPPDVDPVYLS
jgi:hypothetical protein